MKTAHELIPRRLGRGRHYRFALILEGLLILAAMAALLDGSFWGHYLASAACGLQNGLVTRYSDALVRTTHLTGIITDLGLMVGARLRGVPFDRRKAILFLLIVGGFIAGSGIGAILFRYLGFVALSIPAILAFAISALYGLYSYRRRLGDS
ncbi:DUF1275 family protein [Tamilnaduibacter salinus]|uniref:DUF1275 family protein n=1 Tax=Tamilnaduibacter salinus TaxID=1484056 RepID=UPI000E3262C5